ncbi:fimbria/pilus outer membrane usher protein [Halobacteriovorax marinus]|nr:fimbria/pilus outer membrane usher protein [Halobacteriovorax marinus]
MNKSLILSLFLLTSNVRAQSEAEIFSKVFKTKTRWVPTAIYFQGSEIGEVPVKYTNNIPSDVLNISSLLSSIVRDDVILKDEQMSFKELSALGVSLSLNEEKFYIEAFIDPKKIREKVTNFNLEYRPKWVNKITRPSDFSFYTNLYYYNPYKHNSNRNDGNELDIQPNFNFKGLVIESSHTYKDDELHRRSTRALYDFQTRATRLSLGDSTTPSTDYLSGIGFLGASYGKDFSLRPYDITVPRGKAEFELTEASTVRVFVNGTLINILKLQAGTHKLEDLPLIQGLNQIKLVIESELGRVDEILIPAAFSQDLLKVGLSDFYYGVGKKSEIVNLDREYADDDYIYTAFYRRGISDKFTLGGFFQADTKARLLGSDQVFSTKFGQFKTQVAALDSNLDTGYSAKAEYFFLDQRTVGTAASGHLFGFEHRNKNFKLIDQLNPLGFDRNILSYAFNKNIYGYSYRIGGQYESNELNRDTWALTGSLGKTFKRRLNVNTVSTYRTLVNGDDNFEVSIYFSWFLPEKGHNFYGSYNSLSKTTQASLQKIKTSSSDKLTYQLTGRNSSLEKSLEFDSRYDHERFEVGVRHSQLDSTARDEGWNSYEGSVKFATAFAYLDGKYTVGRPITNSFAILTRDKHLEDEQILISSNGDNIAKGDLFNNILISKIQPYRYYKVTADSALLSDGLSIEESDFALMPTYKSGSLISLQSKGAMSVFGTIFLPDRTRVALATFDVLDAKGRVVYGSFTNRKGRILVEGLEEGEYQVLLRHQDENYVSRFTLPKDKVGFVDIGNLNLTKVKK